MTENTPNQSDLIAKIETSGFKIRGNKVLKHSNKSKNWDIAGQLNNAGVYFYASNVSPFVTGQNTYKDLFNLQAYQYIEPLEVTDIAKEQDFKFEEYLKVTKSSNQFGIFAKQLKKTYKSTFHNLYDLRGAVNGGLRDATLFPYINIDNQFITAKIVKYNTITGKRVKGGYSTNWFHSEKNILKSLDKPKASKSVNCFFGEHLLKDGTTPVVIVEAEKTAVLLSSFFKNITFIASGGLAKLEALDYSFLKERDVFLFPDNGASDWFEIAKERNWFCSDVLEINGAKGSDVADYLIDYVNENLDANGLNVWFDISKQLLDIDKGYKYKNVSKDFDFIVKRKADLNNILLAFTKDDNTKYYSDNSVNGGYSVKGNNFTIYTNKFDVLTCNINVNKADYDKKNKIYKLTDEQGLIRRLERIYRVHKHFNSDNHIEAFTKALWNISINSNYSFNVDYVLNNLVNYWNSFEVDVWSEYSKSRNWVFSSNKKIDEKDFSLRLNEDLALFRMHLQAKRLYELIPSNKFIEASNIGLKRKEDNSQIWNIIKDYNTKRFGASTLKMYNNSLIVNEYISVCFKLRTLYSNSIECTKKSTTFKNSKFYPTINQISQNTNLTRRAVKNIIEFKEDAEILDNTLNTLFNIISNPKSFSFTRSNASGRTRLVLEFKPPTDNKTLPMPNSKEAFDYDLDTSESIMHCNEQTALNKGLKFYNSWCLFNDKPVKTDEDMMQIYTSLNNPFKRDVSFEEIIESYNLRTSKFNGLKLLKNERIDF